MSIPPISPSQPPFSSDPSGSAWQEILADYTKLQKQKNDILALLEQDPPDWDAINRDLDTLQDIVQDIQNIVQENHLKPPSGDLQELLSNMLALIGKLRDASGDRVNFTSRMNSFIADMNALKKIIMQGANITLPD